VELSQIILEEPVRYAQKRPWTGSAMSPFWYSVSENKGFKRLHRRQGCGTRPEECFEAHEVMNLDKLRVDARCRHCWPSQEGNAESSSGSGSESSSSSSSEEEQIAREPV
jgi:hypothetical protein